jgi:hypothetical protein
MAIIPYLITFLIGTLSLSLILEKRSPLPGILFIGLSTVTGISITIFITFFSFAIFNQFHLFFIYVTHLSGIALLLLFPKTIRCIPYKKPGRSFFVAAFITLASGALAFIYARAYPFGGWDAWQVWNFKSKFLLLSGFRWKELLDPLFWRTSPHYPLGLPLFNAWTWAFNDNTSVSAPMVNAVLFVTLVTGIMIGILQQHCSSKLLYLPIFILPLSPTYMLFMTNQYCDVVVNLFFLATLITIIETRQSSNRGYLIPAGIFIATLSFLKPEGSVLACLSFLSAHFYLPEKSKKIPACIPLWTSTLLFMIPLILFFLFLSPGNQTFTNGLISADHPATITRLIIILKKLFYEMYSPKWYFLWWILLLAGILNLKKIFLRGILIFPFIIVTYLCVVIFYYWLNTHFPIEWWLDSSLNRVLAVILPTVIIWLSLSILPEKTPTVKGNLEIQPKKMF